ncbi:hypothetical protein NO932_06615 [Pelagibacterium sp. 26DY04]|uniref:hypothetical protein n=1 Tax=Pelagibacterium sp. 26DY04 TaxID=2967130 RepID=UPI002814F99A|nr:hypothetical protein [Pelagibacterium sp. 26DY04]WMT88278.1 hypothetical protein NO932_06615 [Pelagibacterium sp. 26DY04]
MIRSPRPLPDPNIAIIDLRTGRLTREWYQYIREIDTAVRALIDSEADHETRISDLETP